jgi:signal transduction histidine kinase
MRARRPLFVAIAVSGAVTLAVALFPRLTFASRIPSLRATVDTAPVFIAFAACFVVSSRLRRRPRLNELILACSFGVLGLSELACVTVPMLLQRFWPGLSVWAALIDSAFGAALFMLAALAPRRTLRRLGPGVAVSATVIVITLLLITLLTTRSAARPLGTDAALSTLEAATAAFYGVAAAGFLRRSEQFHDRFSDWLTISAVLASAAHLNYFLHPAFYTNFASIGDVLLLCFYAVLLAGSAQEIRSRWRERPEVAVLEERQRIARNLHDGPVQELAYLVRNLDSLDGVVDGDTKTHLQRAAERAQLDLRVTIDTFAVPRRQSVNLAVAQAVGEIAARDHIKLELDVISGMQLSAPRADALVRIACEAVSNAARHSGAARVSLSVQRQGSSVRLCVSDDGSGFDPAVATDGFGLISMHDRATLVGGNLRISSVPGRGTEVEAML